MCLVFWTTNRPLTYFSVENDTYIRFLSHPGGIQPVTVVSQLAGTVPKDITTRTRKSPKVAVAAIYFVLIIPFQLSVTFCHLQFM